MIGATPQVDVPIKSQRFSQLPCPGTDGKFPTTTREGGEWWRHPIAGTEGVSGRMAALPCPGCEGVAAEAACAGLGAVDAGSAGSAGSAERLCLRLLVGVLIPSSRRGSIALRRDKVSCELCSDKDNSSTVQCNNTVHCNNTSYSSAVQ